MRPADAGAVQVGGIGLHLRGETREVFLDWLRSQRPDLVGRYEELYADGAYLPPHERRRLVRLIAAASRDPAPGSSDQEGTPRFRAMRERRRGGADPPAYVGPPPAGSPGGAQTSLF